MDELATPAWGTVPVPEFCQRAGCLRPVETWCPLCESFLCAEHDQLTPVRQHTCLGRELDVG